MGLWRVLALVLACASIGSTVAFAQEHESDPPADEAGDDPIANRGDRYQAEPPGTIKKMRFWYGPYTMPAGWDANRVDLDIPVHNGMILKVEPELRVGPDWKEPSHQVAHIHHAHWFALDPGNKEDNYTAGNTEWIFGNGDEETRADKLLTQIAEQSINGVAARGYETTARSRGISRSREREVARSVSSEVRSPSRERATRERVGSARKRHISETRR